MTKENKNTSFRRYFLNTGIQWYFYHQFAFRWHQLLFAKVALLSDAEVLEDVAKDFVGVDLAGDGAKVVQAFAQVLSHQVARGAKLDALAHSIYCGKCCR